MIELQQGSFREIKFNFESTSRKSGRKSVFHTFPNSNIVLAEDLGRLPRSVSMNIYISGKDSIAESGSGERFEENNYYSKRDALVEALEQKGPGKLVHPTYGTIQVQLEGAYSVAENITSLNKATISVTFVFINDADFLPTDTFSPIGISNASNEINERAANAVDAIVDTATETGWNIVKDNVEAIQAFGEDALKVVTDSELYNTLTTQIQDLSTFFTTNIENMGTELDDLFTTIEESIGDPRDRFNQFAKLFNYNDDIFAALPLPTTRDLLTQSINVQAFREFVQIESLTRSINSAVDITYKTEDELIDVSSQIYDQFDKVVEL